MLNCACAACSENGLSSVTHTQRGVDGEHSSVTTDFHAHHSPSTQVPQGRPHCQAQQAAGGGRPAVHLRAKRGGEVNRRSEKQGAEKREEGEGRRRTHTGTPRRSTLTHRHLPRNSLAAAAMPRQRSGERGGDARRDTALYYTTHTLAHAQPPSLTQHAQQAHRGTDRHTGECTQQGTVREHTPECMRT